MNHSTYAGAAFLLYVVLACSPIRPQSPGLKVTYGSLADQSSVVVVGVVEATQWVIRPDRRRSKTTPLAGGRQIVELQDPSEYMVGRIARLRVSEVLKGGAKVKAGSVVSVFVPGLFGGENAPALAERQKYVIFLSPMKANAGEFAGTVVYQPGASPGGEPQFVPKSHYVVVGDRQGAVPVAAENSSLVNQIRGAVRRPRG